MIVLLQPICGCHYNAPLREGEKVHHMWLCERPKGHAGPHASPSHSISLTMASRRFTLDAIIAAIPCDDCGRTDGTHDLDVEH